ncbi:hypothetical protein EXU57_00585 [Segetibacter sp. 3557_3]|nr:hypothetical protein EXU57_00585 [Segetibacter sp. 3557_3]
MKTKKPVSHDEYISRFTPEVQQILQQMRETIRSVVPEAEETIKYDMPTFFLNGNLVYYAAFKKHIGFYPVPTGNPEFDPLFKSYKTGKGSIQFPFDQPLPLDLIIKIVNFRVRANKAKAAAKPAT